MALIDREELRKKVRRALELPVEARVRILGIIGQEVPVDAVQVVRCKNCRSWRHPWLEGQTSGRCVFGRVRITEPEHFCSYGQRRDE